MTIERVPAVALFRSLADEARLSILLRLAGGEARVLDLTRQLGLAQSTVSGHLACLRDCGLVDYRVQGRQSFYRLTRPELMGLLAAAEDVLAATGSAVALCPRYGAGPATAGPPSDGRPSDGRPTDGRPTDGAPAVASRRAAEG